jgi:putative transposase
MARPLRIQFDGAWYHVMNRGANRKKIFFNNENRKYFLNLLGEITKIYGIEVHTYCLMSNHYHLIIHTPRGNLSQAMRHLNATYTQYLNRFLRKDGALFRGRYKSIIISADEYLIRLSRYIHLNPKKANIDQHTLDYQWSSYPIYINKHPSPAWLVTTEIITRFHNNPFDISYKKYVETTDDGELDKFYEEPKFQPVLGGNCFRENIFSYIKSHSLSAGIVRADKILIPPSIETILREVSIYFDVDPSDIIHCIRRVKNPARQVAIFICRNIGGYSLQKIGDIMGNVSIKTISSTLHRVKLNTLLMKEAENISFFIRKNLKFISETKP